MKRKASTTALETSPTTSTRGRDGREGETAIHAFLTPRKSAPRLTQPPSREGGYTGPILDPHPSNPFSASPRKTPLKSTSSGSRAAAAGIYSTGPILPTPSKPPLAYGSTAAPAASSSSSTAWDANSPFIHATTPKKLKQVLAANSLRKVRARLDGGSATKDGQAVDELDIAASPSKGKSPFERMGRHLGAGPQADITPRTKARKRLAGEMVAPTPGKAPRKRGMVRVSTEMNGRDGPDDMVSGAAAGAGQGKGTGKRVMLLERSELDDEQDMDEGEDEFGPSPAKGLMRSFTSLIGEAVSDEEDEALSYIGTRLAGGKGEREGQGKGRGIFASRLAAAPPAGMARAKGEEDAQRQEGRGGKRVKPSKMGMSMTVVGRDDPVSQALAPDDADRRTVPAFVGAPDESPFLTRSPKNHTDGIASTHTAEPANGMEPANDVEEQGDDRLPTPPPHTELDAESDEIARSQSTGKTPSRPRRKVLSLSDDEVDEFDPEADRHKRVTIVPTRRIVRRRNSSDLESDLDLQSHGRSQTPKLADRAVSHTINGNGTNINGVTDETDGDVDMATPSTPTAPSSTRLLTPPPCSSHSPSSSRSTGVTTTSATKKGHEIPPHLLSLLSLRSPVRPRSKTSGAIADLRARAIFDPEAKRELRAIEKGQEVRVAGGMHVSSARARVSGAYGGGGEVEGEEEERLLVLYGARRGRAAGGEGGRGGGGEDEEDGDGGGEGQKDGEGEMEEEMRERGDAGDDDWDSESEGWKRTGEDMDDW